MGERRVDSCTEVNRRSLCVLATTTKICDQLSVSVSGKGIIERFWVGAEKGCAVVEEDSGLVIMGTGLENFNIFQYNKSKQTFKSRFLLFIDPRIQHYFTSPVCLFQAQENNNLSCNC